MAQNNNNAGFAVMTEPSRSKKKKTNTTGKEGDDMIPLTSTPAWQMQQQRKDDDDEKGANAAGVTIRLTLGGVASALPCANELAIWGLVFRDALGSEVCIGVGVNGEESERGKGNGGNVVAWRHRVDVEKRNEGRVGTWWHG